MTLSTAVRKGAKGSWLHDILNLRGKDEVMKIAPIIRKSSLCTLCKGSRRLCGKLRCPIIVKANYYLKSAPLMNSEDITGSSPPSVFIGRIGYPKVFAGPLVPPVLEDTSLFDFPEYWFGKSIDQIVAFRSLLIRGKHRVGVKEFVKAGKLIDKTRELAMAIKPVDIELKLAKKPRGRLFLDGEVQPFGPSAPMRDIQLGNTKWEQHVEKAYFDTDLKATQAVIDLYQKGVPVTKIQKPFSVGAFGVKTNRKLVPTRWSITAVDDILSKNLIRKVKNFQEISEYRIYESVYLDNF